jgi:hypothetical protein
LNPKKTAKKTEETPVGCEERELKSVQKGNPLGTVVFLLVVTYIIFLLTLVVLIKV